MPTWTKHTAAPTIQGDEFNEVGLTDWAQPNAVASCFEVSSIMVGLLITTAAPKTDAYTTTAPIIYG